MGFLYPWSRIVCGRIPKLETFDVFARELVEAMAEHQGVCAASIYGSVARGDHTVRSDLDFVAVCEQDSLRSVRVTIRAFVERAQAFHLIMSPHVITTGDCLTGKTRFGPSFRETFHKLARESSSTFGNPHELLCPDDRDVVKEMRSKLLFNMRTLSQAHAAFVSTSNINDPEIFDQWCELAMQSNQRLLHVYMGFARWMLWWKHGTLKDDTKQGVINQFLCEQKFLPLHTDFLVLRQIDTDYDDLLERCRTGKVRRRVYVTRVVTLIRRAFRVCSHMFTTAALFMGIRQPQAFARQAELMAA